MWKIIKRLVLGSVVLLISIYISVLLYITSQVNTDTKKESDVIIVLGARSYKQGKYNPCLVARMDHAIGIYKDGYTKKLLFTGGNDVEDNVNEAETMQKIAVGAKVATESILLEKKATSSYENLLYSKKIMEDNKLKTAIIVTEPFHSPRAGMIAKKLNIDYSLSPTQTSVCWNRWKYLSRYFLREPLAIIQYWMKGKI